MQILQQSLDLGYTYGTWELNKKTMKETRRYHIGHIRNNMEKETKTGNGNSF